jgi:hypothetical protein
MWLRVVVVGRHLDDGVGVAGAKRVEQFLRLSSELIEIGTVGERAGW